MMHFCRVLVELLVASLWQSTAIDLIVAAALSVAGSRLNAVTRHVIFQAALIAMIVTPIVTTMFVIGGLGVTVSGYGASSFGAASSNGISASAGARIVDLRLSDPVVFSLAAVWLAGFAFFAIRLALGYIRLARVLQGSMHLSNRGSIALFVSASVDTPFAAGFVRPAIVVPKTLVGGGAELECAILHETAHVRRHDAWSQMFELIAEAVFFFNPAVLFILRALRWQREAACDDWAAKEAASIEMYTCALANLALRCTHKKEMIAACGAIGFEHPTVRRIERLEDPRRNSSLNLSRIAVGGSIIMILSVAFAIQAAAPAVAISGASRDSAPPPAIVTTAPLNSCNHDVTVTQAPVPTGPLPPGRTALVDVQVAASGAVKNAKIEESSGNVTFDRVTTDLARKSTYAPAVQNCKPVASVYKYMLSSHGRP